MPLLGLSCAWVRGGPHWLLEPVACAVLLLSFAVAPARSVLAAPAVQAGSLGETLFQTKCAACHTIGKGKLVGPDLQDLAARRDPEWTRTFIVDPNAMFASDPTAQQLLAEYNNVKMPTLGLTDAEVDALVVYLQPGAAATGGQAQASAQAAGPQSAALASSTVAGQRLFAGSAGLANGGPACIGCHSVSGLGGLGGGALGPDLTHAAARYPGPALSSVLGNIAFPTMVGPFTNRTLTPQEQADLVAYLTGVDQTQGAASAAAPAVTAGAITRDTGLMLVTGGIGAFALILVLAVFWPQQRQSVSARLRRQRRSAAN